jgi:hypothetical protein
MLARTSKFIPKDTLFAYIVGELSYEKYDDNLPYPSILDYPVYIDFS